MIEEFERTGNLLFRGRSYFPLALYVALAALIGFGAIAYSPFDTVSAVACLGVSMFGQLIRALTIGYTPRGTSGRNTKAGQVAEQLNTRGMYSLVRHPLYFGNFFMWLGIILYAGSPWFTLVCCLAYWIYYERIMFAEEAFLRRSFGEPYLVWSEQVPAFFPKKLGWTAPGVDFSLRNVLKREYNGFFAVFLSLALVDVGRNAAHAPEAWTTWLHPFWQGALLVSFAIFLTLRSLKRYTRILHVEGR
jgi:protein-S-isoprenylcysteine O-methyltransferase Ste14